MSQMRFRLFGAFQARLAGEITPNFITGKLEELFCFLLLHRQMMTARESLAALLWEDTTTAQSKKYLRDALWKLQEKLALSHANPPVLLASPECVRLHPQADVWADVTEFETTFAQVEGIRGAELTREQAQSLQKAAELYRGELLEGWYQDWCLCERVRFQEIHQKMLHKLMGWCEANGQYEQGLHYGDALLRSDVGQERAHRTMMRLRYLAGDRTGAMRQYERCAATLLQEMGVQPSRRTLELYEQIRADQAESLSSEVRPLRSSRENAVRRLPELLAQCKHLLATLTTLEQQVQHEVEMIEQSLKEDG
jgi:DNA-binding SARP family transcriptional activator